MDTPMHRLLAALVLGLACWCSGAGAQAQKPEQEETGAQAGAQAGTVHINAIKDPERWTYRAIAAGLDMFDEQHALAPNVPQLLFKVDARGDKAWSGEAPAARIAADDFSIPLTLDEQRRFAVARSEAAYRAKAELVLNRKKRDAQVMPWIRTPGLAGNQRRLGDIRLDCKVMIAVGKEEAPFWVVGLVNGVLLTTDWCSWFKGATPKGGDRGWPHHVDAKLAAATLHDGERSVALKIYGKSFRAPIGDTSWSNDAIVELEYALPEVPEAVATE
jgi:hypothetical protein